MRTDARLNGTMINGYGLTVALLVIGLSARLGEAQSEQVAVQEPINGTASSRQARWFPFYTIGRFQNSPCMGASNLLGTCILGGECADNGGIATGSCSAVTGQAVCCIYQMACGMSTDFNNTYFYNPDFPKTYRGGSRCTIRVTRADDAICQLRVDFLDFTLAPPSGDGACNTDYMAISGGSSTVPRLCGQNTGQHVYVNFNGNAAVQIAIETTAGYSFNRHWHFKLTQVPCSSHTRAPTGCLQYHLDPDSGASGPIRSFNYGAMPSADVNSIGVQGTRQLANMHYGICIRAGANKCSIKYSLPGSDPYAFTMNGDVGAVDPTLLGTGVLASQDCTTDYVIIPYPSQGGSVLSTGTDRFCGLGFNDTTSGALPFVLYVRTDANELMDIGNRGFALDYSQGQCPIQ